MLPHLPYDGYLGKVDTSTLLEKLLRDPSSGLPTPAAVILEPIQGEGGINVASARWLKNVAEICSRYGVLLISDEIQVGNGRTGDFFAFEASGIKPDMVCLSKSLGGGLPISLVMMRPDLDVWKPGQHTGTFRGNNLAFVAGRTLLDHFWSDTVLSDQVRNHECTIRQTLEALATQYPDAVASVRGRGMIWGIELKPYELAVQIARKAFELGLVIETCGPEDQVVKLLPPLIVNPAELDFGLQLLVHAFAKVLKPSSGTDDLATQSIACTDLSTQMWNPAMAEQSIDTLSNLTDELVVESMTEKTYDNRCTENNFEGIGHQPSADLVVADGAVFVDDDQWIEETLLPTSL
jgi:diaminobutyrate-2-oxoglutarate transaminase